MYRNHIYLELYLAVEEEGSECGSVMKGQRSRESSICNNEVAEEGKKAGKKTRKDSEKGGIFKGLGSMFRYVTVETYKVHSV